VSKSGAGISKDKKMGAPIGEVVAFLHKNCPASVFKERDLTIKRGEPGAVRKVGGEKEAGNFIATL
jgi:hypothetical protein